MIEVTWKAAVELWSAHPGRQKGSWQNLPAFNVDQRHHVVGTALEGMRVRAYEAEPDDPWLVEVARTAVPEALAEDFRARRKGSRSGQAKAALGPFLDALTEEFL